MGNLGLKNLLQEIKASANFSTRINLIYQIAQIVTVSNVNAILSSRRRGLLKEPFDATSFRVKFNDHTEQIMEGKSPPKHKLPTTKRLSSWGLQLTIPAHGASINNTAQWKTLHPSEMLKTLVT